VKYINQINFALAAVGIVIVGYSLSQTLLAPEVRSDLDLDQLRQIQPRIIEQPEATEAPAALMNATSTARSAAVPVRESRPKPPAERPESSAQPAIAGRNAPAPAPAPSRRNFQPQAPSTPVWLGDRNERAKRRGSGVVTPRSAITAQPALPPQGGVRGSGGRPTGSLIRPPAGAEGYKRDGTNDPAAPPVRSSMAQTPRRP